MSGETTFKIGENSYRTRAMDARMQFHVATKFASVLSSFSGAEDRFAAVGEALGRLRPDDADFVINSCLSVVEREIPGGAAWSPVMVNGQIMFEDLRTSLAALMQMVIPVVRANVTGFLSELPKDFLPQLMAGLPGKSS